MKHHSYIQWIDKGPQCKQAAFVNCERLRPDTPEHFYHTEQEFRSGLLEMCIARGMNILGRGD